MKTLFKTNPDTSSLILRAALGAVFFPHGAQLLLGWFGGYGFTGSMGFFTGTMHIPAALAFLAIMAQFAGSLALLAGLFTRVAAAGIFSVMAVAAYTVHLPYGFFMNWYGAQKGEGFEYHLLALAMALALILKGGGKWALDTLIFEKLNQGETPARVSSSSQPALAKAH
jgi:putative oxidoreductase